MEINREAMGELKTRLMRNVAELPLNKQFHIRLQSRIPGSLNRSAPVLTHPECTC